MATERKFAPGFVLEIPGVLTHRDEKATTPEEALAFLLRSKHGYSTLVALDDYSACLFA